MTRPVTVGIATFRRESLKEALVSVDAQMPVRAEKIIVADNDETPAARARVEDIAATLRTPVAYLHAPAGNIAIARNAILDAAGHGLLAFIDDDETAAPDWLLHLTRALTPDVAAVMGPMHAVYPDHAPDWMKKLSPHSQIPPSREGLALEGHTANCLIDLDHLAMADVRFDEGFGRKGGSDSVYFAVARRRDAVFAYAPDAAVFEPVSERRLSREWLLKRRWRFGQTLAATRQRSAPATIALSAAKIAYCAGDALLHVASPAGFHRALLRGALHLGVAAGAAGAPMADWYGKTDPA